MTNPRALAGGRKRTEFWVSTQSLRYFGLKPIIFCSFNPPAEARGLVICKLILHPDWVGFGQRVWTAVGRRVNHVTLPQNCVTLSGSGAITFAQ